MYFVYIIYSKSKDKYYVGSCADILVRLSKHNTNHSGFNGKTGDWEIKWFEKQSDKFYALKREKQIKTGKAE